MDTLRSEFANPGPAYRGKPFWAWNGKLEADEIVFAQTGRVNKSSSEQVIDAADRLLSGDAMRALWLRNVETRPADFLAARFSYQLATRESIQAKESVAGSDD